MLLLLLLHTFMPLSLTCPNTCCSSSPAFNSTTSQSAAPRGSTTTATAAATAGSTSNNTSAPGGSCRAAARCAGSSIWPGEVAAAPDQATNLGRGLRVGVGVLLNGLRAGWEAGGGGGGGGVRQQGEGVQKKGTGEMEKL